MADGTVEICEHVTQLEDLISVPTDGKETNQTVMVGMEKIWSELQSFCTMIENHVKDTGEQTDSVLADVKAFADDHKAKLSKLDAEIGILKMVIHSFGSASGTDAFAFKKKFPEPKPFFGGKNVKELENFLWDVSLLQGSPYTGCREG